MAKPSSLCLLLSTCKVVRSPMCHQLLLHLPPRPPHCSLCQQLRKAVQTLCLHVPPKEMLQMRTATHLSPLCKQIPAHSIAHTHHQSLIQAPAPSPLLDPSLGQSMHSRPPMAEQVDRFSLCWKEGLLRSTGIWPTVSMTATARLAQSSRHSSSAELWTVLKVMKRVGMFKLSSARLSLAHQLLHPR